MARTKSNKSEMLKVKANKSDKCEMTKSELEKVVQKNQIT